MTVTESLKATLTGKGSDLKSTLSGIADKADDVADNMGEAAGAAETFAGTLSEVEDEADDAEQQVNELKNAVKGANRAFDRGILSAGGYASMLERIDDADIDVDFDEDDVPESGDYNGSSVHAVGFKLQNTDKLRRKTEEVDDKLKSVTDEVVPRIRLLGYQSSMSKLNRLKAKLEQIDDKVATARVMVTGDDDVDVPATRMVRGYGGGGDGPSGPSAPPRPARAFHGDAFENVARRIAQVDEYAPGSETPPGDEPRDAARAFHGADPFKEYARIFANLDDHAWRNRRASEMGVGPDGSYPGRSLRGRIVNTPIYRRAQRYRSAFGDRDYKGLAQLLSGSDGSFGSSFIDSFKDVFDSDGRLFGDGDDGDRRGILSSATSKVTNKLGGLWKGLSKTSVNLGPFNTKVSTAIKIVPILIGLMGSLATAFGGLAIAAIGAAGVLGGALAGGLLLAGKRADQASSEVEGTMEGIQEYLSGFKDQAMNAVEPLMTMENMNFMEGFLTGGIKTLRTFSKFVNRLMGPLSGMVDRLAAQYWDQQPEFFAELEKTVVAFLPVIEELVSWMMTAAIEGMRYMRKEGITTIDFFLDFIGALFDIFVTLSRLSDALIRLFGPTIVGGLKLLANIADNVASVVIPMLDALAWAVNSVVESPIGNFVGSILELVATFVALYGIGSMVLGFMGTLAGWVVSLGGMIGGLGGALAALASGLTTVVTGLAAIIGWPALIIAGIVVAIGALLHHFGLLDDAVNALLDPFGTLQDIIEDITGVKLVKIEYDFPGKEQMEKAQEIINGGIPGEEKRGKGLKKGKDFVGFEHNGDKLGIKRDSPLGKLFGLNKKGGGGGGGGNMPDASSRLGGGGGGGAGGQNGTAPLTGDTYIQNYGETTETGSKMQQRVEDAMQRTSRYDRRAGNPHN